MKKIYKKCQVCHVPREKNGFCDDCASLARHLHSLHHSDCQPRAYKRLKEQRIRKYMRRAEKALPLFDGRSR